MKKTLKSLCTGVHIEMKKLLKKFIFSQRSETNLPSTSRGDIVGIFHYRANGLK